MILFSHWISPPSGSDWPTGTQLCVLQRLPGRASWPPRCPLPALEQGTLEGPHPAPSLYVGDPWLNEPPSSTTTRLAQ